MSRLKLPKLTMANLQIRCTGRRVAQKAESRKPVRTSFLSSIVVQDPIINHPLQKFSPPTRPTLILHPPQTKPRYDIDLLLNLRFAAGPPKNNSTTAMRQAQIG